MKKQTVCGEHSVCFCTNGDDQTIMNLLHMKYAVEVANTRSINKAAETLYVGQSALSRAIKELESTLGTKLFERSTKGVTLTPEGELFVRYARTVLEQVDDLEAMFKVGTVERKRFSLASTRASYVAAAFAEFSKSMTTPAELIYTEVSSMQALRSVAADEYKLGLVRYADCYENYYSSVVSARGLVGQHIGEFPYKIVFSTDSPLAKKETITPDDLSGLTRIEHADPYLPSPPSEMKKVGTSPSPERRIFVFERASRFEILSKNPHTYTWVSPIPVDVLDRYNLTERFVEGEDRVYRDVLIRRADYRLTDVDRKFVEELMKAKEKLGVGN